MNSQDFNALVDYTIKQTAELLKSKGSEYASDSDRLTNFKKGAEDSGLTPLQVGFIYMRKHYDSIGNYIKKDAKGLTQTLSEPIEGRFHDLINYCFLMLALIEEQKTPYKLVNYGLRADGSIGTIVESSKTDLSQLIPFPPTQLNEEESVKFTQVLDADSCQCPSCVNGRAVKTHWTPLEDWNWKIGGTE